MNSVSCRFYLSGREKIVSRDEIIERLWDSDEFIDDNTLTVNVARLRKKLESVGRKDMIRTKKGIVHGRMMRLLKRYIREHIRQICLYIGFLGIFQVVFFLYNIRTDAVRYAFFLSVGWLLLYGCLAFLRYYRNAGCFRRIIRQS